MKTKIILVYAAVLALTVSGFGCAKKPSSDDKVLARISNKEITLGQFKERIAKLPAYYQSIVDKNKKRYLDEMILEMMFYEEAVREGLANDKEVKELLKEAKKKVLVAKLIKNEVEDKASVSEAEIRQYYEANKEQFKTPVIWRASHILVPTEKEAKEVEDALAKGGNFEELAEEHSTDMTASRGGDVGYFRQGQMIPEFEKACFNLQPGQTSAILHTQFGYHIIKLTDKKESGIESYDKAKKAIEVELKKKKRSELFDSLVLKLKKKYNVEVEDDPTNYE